MVYQCAQCSKWMDGAAVHPTDVPRDPWGRVERNYDGPRYCSEECRTVAEYEAELIQRADEMGDTEFSVKRARLVRAGGWWPNALTDWETPQGRALSEKIRTAREER